MIIGFVLLAVLNLANCCRGDEVPKPAAPRSTTVTDQASAGTDPLSTGTDPLEIRRQLDNILSRPEYRRVRLKRPLQEEPEAEKERSLPKWLLDFFASMSRWFPNMRNWFGSLGLAWQIIAYTVIAAIAAAIIYLVVRAISQRQRGLGNAAIELEFEEGDAGVPPGELPADVYVSRARELADRGEYRDAIGQLLLGAMSSTERQGMIRFRRGLTHRDYLKAWRGKLEQFQGFRTMIDVYEPIGFGRRVALREHFETSLRGYESGFQHA